MMVQDILQVQSISSTAGTKEINCWVMVLLISSLSSGYSPGGGGQEESTSRQVLVLYKKSM